MSDALEAATALLGAVDGVEIVPGRLRRCLAARHRPDLHWRPARRRPSASTAGAASICWRATTPSPIRSPPPPGRALTRHDFVLEGGALDHDGAGHGPHHPPVPAQPQPQPGLARGRRRGGPWPRPSARARCIWLDQGLMNDHTDGHVDNLARFVAPGVVACPVAFGPDDPNAAAYDAAAQALAVSTGDRRRAAQGGPDPLARPDQGRRPQGDARLAHELHHRQRRGDRSAL